MAEVILLCGRICSGKSFVAEQLRRERKAVILSVDEITLALPEEPDSAKFDIITEGIRSYLAAKSVEIINAGADVILDWGFWTKKMRDEVKNFYALNKIDCKLYYVQTDEKTLDKNISLRNNCVSDGNVSAYKVDAGLAEKCAALFEIPDKAEIDRIIDNRR